MTILPKFHLLLHGSMWLYLAALAVLIFFVWWAYRYTLPPVSWGLRILLFCLRLFSLGFILLMLFDPVLEIRTQSLRKSRIALLLDQSASMSISDSGTIRSRKMEDILRSSEMARLGSRSDLSIYTFSDRLIPLKDFSEPLQNSGLVTDMEQVLSQLGRLHQKEDFDAGVLISDGRFTRGRDPLRIAETMTFPVNTILIGDDKQQPDLILVEAVSNEVAYVGDTVPVLATLSGPGFGGEQVRLRFDVNGSLEAEQIVTIPADAAEITHTFHFKPQSSGIAEIRITLTSPGGELSLQNNSTQTAVKVLKQKMRILLLADRPNPDLAALQRILNTDKNIKATVRTIRSGTKCYEGSFPSVEHLREFDCFILVDVPSGRVSAGVWNALSQQIQNGMPVMLFAGKYFDASRLGSEIRENLPFSFSRRPSPVSVLVSRTHSGETHPLLQPEEVSGLQDAQWEDLPPIYSCFSPVQVRKEAGILMNARMEQSEDRSFGQESPLLGIYDAGDRKALVFAGYGLYRWPLFLAVKEKKSFFLDDFMRKSIRWLTSGQGNKQFRLSLNKRAYQTTETVYVNAKAYDETMAPLSGAAVIVRLVQKGVADRFLDMKELERGIYEAEFPAVQSGRAWLKGELRVQNERVVLDSVEFSISDNQPEFLNTTSDPVLMRGLADVTGGLFAEADSASALIDALRFEPQMKTTLHSSGLAHPLWGLLLLLLLLSTEWLIRKRKAML